MTQAPTLPAYPQGYLSLAKNIGIKDDTLDLTVVYSTARAAAAGGVYAEFVLRRAGDCGARAPG